MKSLSRVQLLVKIARILCIVGFWFCAVGLLACIVGFITMPLVQDFSIGEGKTVTDAIVENGSSLGEVYGGLLIGLLSCGVGVFVSLYNSFFFKKELVLGTPFDHEIVRDMRKVALVNIIVSFALGLAAAIGVAIIQGIFGEKLTFKYELLSTVSFGIFLLIISLFCEYGADVKKA